MIFLPNKTERYLMILRNTVTNMILKRGITDKNIRLLRIIHSAEAFFSDLEIPTDITAFSNEILSHIFIKKTEKNLFFRFSLGNFRNVLINKNLYLTLILILGKNSDTIFITQYKNGILIKCKSRNFKDSLPFVKKLGGTYFNELKKGVLNILLFPEITEKKPYKTATDQEIFLGPLSVINLYLN